MTDGGQVTLTAVRFWLQVIRESERTVVCSPELESRVKAAVDALGLGGVVSVVVNRYAPDDRVYIIPGRPPDGPPV